MTNQELSEIAKLVAELTQQKLKVTPHLDVGNFAANLFGKLLGEYKLHIDICRILETRGKKGRRGMDWQAVV